MAKLNDLLSSVVSGKLGNVVFVQLDGKTIMRRTPIRRKDSRSEKQVLNQQRFKDAVQFCNQFKYTLIPRIWNDAAREMTGFGYFLKSNMPAFPIGGGVPDATKICLSAGKLPLPPEFRATRMPGNPWGIQVSWEQELCPGTMSSKDELLVVSARQGVYSELQEAGIQRSHLGGTFELPDQPSPATHLYLFFVSTYRRDYSSSVCFEI